MNTTIIGGAMLPHAPQFFTMPDTEDRGTIARVQEVAAEIGKRLKALAPDLWIIFANDHAGQFFHQAAPPFTIHVGGEAEGGFAGRRFHWRVPGETGFELVRRLYREGFDPAFTSTAGIGYAIGIPLTHLGLVEPVLPIWVNAYLPPQPTMARCWAFGEAVARAVTAMGLRTAVLASGGMSHFPGTERYGEPDLAFDREVLAGVARGNLKSLLGLDEARLDETGNVELRCWACAAGALGERRPDIVELEPSWHHNYASIGCFAPPPAPVAPHYPAIRPDRVALTRALHALAHEAEARAAYRADPAGFADGFRLQADERAALLALDLARLRALGIHPLVPFLARMEIERERAATPPLFSPPIGGKGRVRGR